MSWLSEIRTNKSMTQEAIAESVGIARASYTNIETGERKPSVGVAKRIASVLDFDWTDFFSDDAEKVSVK